MLNAKRSITLEGTSTINGVTAAGYKADISSTNPENMELSNWQVDKTVYKENRAQCYEDLKAFEDMAYAIQKELIDEKAAAAIETE